MVNAGIQHIDALEDLSFENWRKVVSVHLDAAFSCSQLAYKRMLQHQRGGSVLFIGSVHSKAASPLKAPYVAAKHGMVGLARALAKEGGKYGIRSNVLCPGCVRFSVVMLL